MTRVSESASSPWASPTCSEPAAPDRREVREPVEDGDVGHAVGPGQLPGGLQPPGDAEVGQDRPGLVDHQERPGPGARRLADSAACSHAVAQAMSTPSAGECVERREVEDDERAVERSSPGVVGAVEHAPQVAVDQAAQLERDVAPVLEQRAAVGADAGRRVRGRGRAARRPPPAGSARRRPCRADAPRAQVDRHPLPGRSGRPQAGRGERGQQLDLAAAAVARRRDAPPPSGPGSSGLSRTAPPGRSATGTDAPGRGQRAVLPLRVDDPGPPAEDRLAPEVGLDEARSCPGRSGRRRSCSGCDTTPSR